MNGDGGDGHKTDRPKGSVVERTFHFEPQHFGGGGAVFLQMQALLLLASTEDMQMHKEYPSATRFPFASTSSNCLQSLKVPAPASAVN